MNRSLDRWSRYTEIYVSTRRTASAPQTNDISTFIKRGQLAIALERYQEETRDIAADIIGSQVDWDWIVRNFFWFGPYFTLTVRTECHAPAIVKALITHIPPHLVELSSAELCLVSRWPVVRSLRIHMARPLPRGMGYESFDCIIAVSRALEFVPYRTLI